MRPIKVCFLVSIAVCLNIGFTRLSLGQDSEEDVSTGLPSQYAKNYVIAASTLSPDKKFAVIYPREDGETFPKGKNYVVSLRPFAIVGLVSPELLYFQHESNAEIAATWSDDDSVAVVSRDAKWGPSEVILLELGGGKVARATDLVPKLAKLLRPAYRKSRPDASPWEFTFVDVTPTIDGARQITIDAEAHSSVGYTEDPVWVGHVKATWDIAQAKFISEKAFGKMCPPDKLE
jgi:hypothetical protein